MELNANLALLAHHRVGLAAIIPDPVEVLARFASANGLAYRLLSDPGGEVVNRFGLLNTNIPPNERQAPGLPFPGHFLLDPNGTVLAKAFTGDLRHRPSASVLVFERFGPIGDPTVRGPRFELWFSATRLYGGQELSVHCRTELAGPCELRFEAVGEPTDLPNPLVVDQKSQWREGIMRGRLRLRWSPPKSIFAGLEDAVAGRAIAPGNYELVGTLVHRGGETRFNVVLTVLPHVPAESRL